MPAVDRFDMSSLDETLREEVRRAPLPPLSAGPRVATLARAVKVAEDKMGLTGVTTSEPLLAVFAGLWLLAGDLERSHEISQGLSNRDGSFWHGVMHRREGDFDNARYWFRRLGDHPAYGVLGEAVAADPLAAGLSDGRWDAVRFVGQCERALQRGVDIEQQCVQAQWIEWQVMMADCLDRVSAA